MPAPSFAEAGARALRRPAWRLTTPAGAAARRGRRRLLVVDDDPDILSTLALALESMLGEPVEVATASSGEEAKRRIEQGERFDLVLTDEKMPGMRGSDLLAWLRASQPATGRALMSAFYEGYAARNLAEQAGAQAFIPKPFQLEAMLADMRRLLGAGHA